MCISLIRRFDKYSSLKIGTFGIKFEIFESFVTDFQFEPFLYLILNY